METNKEVYMEYSALIVAAGSGSRMRLGFNKVYAKLKDGEMILEKTINVFMQDPDCSEIIVVTDPKEYRQKMTKRFPGRIVLCTGGKTRQESVNCGLQAVTQKIVMIHDGARPYVRQQDLDALKSAMETEKACLLTVPCVSELPRPTHTLRGRSFLLQ
jgi:2-C-methyl-D-erythritol 4-phosphate cytidylyltransferase